MAAEGLTVPIHGIGARGEGVGRLDDGRTVFVHRTAPGDLVSVELVHSASRWARGRLLEVLEPADDRRTPPCPLYETCGGCTLQHLPYPEQLGVKRERIEQALARIGGLDVAIGPVAPSPDEFGYRTRATFHLRRLRGGRTLVGFHELTEPGRVLDVDERCLVLTPKLRATWGELRAAWGPGARLLPSGRALDLTLHEVDNGVTLTVRGGGLGGDCGRLVEAVADLIAVWRLEGRGPVLLAGEPTAVHRWHGDELALRPTSFLQANRDGADLLWDAISRGLDAVDGLRVVDAYSGAGAFARAWARAGATVTAIELNPAAAETASSAAPAGLTVITGTVEEHLAASLPADLVIVNPPRVGLSEEVVGILLAAPPPRLVYASCDPATLARDLGRLSRSFDVVRLEALDLFPQTAHVETVTTLKARGQHG